MSTLQWADLTSVELLAIQSKEILLPAVVMGELFYGFMERSRTRYNEEKFHRFVTELEVSTIRVDEEVARKYAIIFSTLTNNGTRIPSMMPGSPPAAWLWAEPSSLAIGISSR